MGLKLNQVILSKFFKFVEQSPEGPRWKKVLSVFSTMIIEVGQYILQFIITTLTM